MEALQAWAAQALLLREGAREPVHLREGARPWEAWEAPRRLGRAGAEAARPRWALA